MQPAEHDLPAARVAHPLDAQAGAANAVDEGPRRDVHEVPREVQVQPAIAEDPRLEAVDVGDGDDDDTVGGQRRGQLRDLLPRVRKVLETVPEDDRRPPPAVAVAASVSALLGALGPDGLAASRLQGSEQGAVAGADVEDGPGRRELVDAAREPSARPPQERVARAREATPLWPVPAGIGAI